MLQTTTEPPTLCEPVQTGFSRVLASGERKLPWQRLPGSKNWTLETEPASRVLTRAQSRSRAATFHPPPPSTMPPVPLRCRSGAEVLLGKGVTLQLVTGGAEGG